MTVAVGGVGMLEVFLGTLAFMPYFTVEVLANFVPTA
jgi:hypothetical protein